MPSCSSRPCDANRLARPNGEAVEHTERESAGSLARAPAEQDMHLEGSTSGTEADQVAVVETLVAPEVDEAEAARTRGKVGPPDRSVGRSGVLPAEEERAAGRQAIDRRLRLASVGATVARR